MMVIRTPAHKNTTNPAGCVTLADYYEVKMEFIPEEPKKKQTFDDWLATSYRLLPEGSDVLRECWNAAKENV